MDAFLRDSGERTLKLIAGIADRAGDPGTVKAARRRDELRAALGDGDEEKTKSEIRGVFAHVAKRDYATDDEYRRAVEIAESMPDDLRELIGADLKNNRGDAAAVKKKRLTIEILQEHLSTLGVDVRRNLITHKIELLGWNQSGEFSQELEFEQFPVILSDELGEGYTGCKPEEIARMIGVIGGRREYNPVLDCLNAKPWDGVDRLPELFKILGITEDSLSQLLVTRWMMQCIAMQYNTIKKPFGAEGVLVLAGKQGCGKSEFSRRIADLDGKSDLFLPGALLDPQDKDAVITSTSRWIVEIGELGSTFNKADMGRLKAFLTKPVDTYRVPFGREDVSTLRRTSYIATVDRADFLTDDSGNRRWWVVEVEQIDLDALDKLDRVQLWRQIKKIVDNDGVQSFRLTPAERQMLNERNKGHEKLIPAEQELADVLAEYRGEVDSGRRFEVRRMSASQIAQVYGLSYSSQQIGRALNKLGVEGGRSNGSTWYLFPDRKYNQTSAN